jgi:signal transduction histidine kinase
MRLPSFSRVSLLWKILLSTSVAITVLFALTGWIVQSYIVKTTSQTLDEEVQASFQAYRSLLKARRDMLASVSRILSTMSDVRAAFSTRDQATIRDTAGELWAKISEENAVFLVTDPRGRVIASLGGAVAPSLGRNLEVVRDAAARFPQQVAGFALFDGQLYQMVVTPVYVESGAGPALLNVLVAGFYVDALVAQRLKEATGGSEFLFVAGGRVMASTLNPRATAVLASAVKQRAAITRVSDGVMEYAPLVNPLPDIEGRPIGDLWIFRSFEGAAQRIAALRRNLLLMWVIAVAAGLGLTFLLARRIVEPVQQLDRAAAEVARQNYACRVSVDSQDELGRLAKTFNAMCASIQNARNELIRQERIATIGRLSSSIVHDLRNPLAAVYGGAEMLVDTELAPQQTKRLAGNIYRASRQIKELLQELLDVSRGKTEGAEQCRLYEVAAAGMDAVRPIADARRVDLVLDIPRDIELPLERARMERVFLNLIGNAIEAMPDGGIVRIGAIVNNGSVEVSVQDNGPGIAASIRERLFQPFVTAGKKNGLGLGLALSRQTVLDHGGDMWVHSDAAAGTTFSFRLPVTHPVPAAHADHNGQAS